MINFSIIITTKDRLKELKYTLNSIKYLIENPFVECIICDDGSEDETLNFLNKYYPEVKLINNETSKGLIYSRNKLMSIAKGKYVISLDDDLHFLTESPLEQIQDYFNKNSKCAVVSFSIFWSKDKPKNTICYEAPYRMKSFAGGAHVFRMDAWKEIPVYPSWFVFYGEEEFASYHLFKKKWEIHYLPEVLVHHRVNIKKRKKDNDYQLRLRRSLRSGWYIYLLFYPWNKIPRKFSYTLWKQVQLKVLKGDFKALFAIFQALFDVGLNIPRLLKKANRLTNEEFFNYSNLKETNLYWKPKE